MNVLFDGVDAAALARRLGLPRVVVFDETTSTMDDAHSLAADGAPSGTLVLAETQTRGRGRSGGTWSGLRGAAILCTLIERVATPSSLDVLSLRVGLNVAVALEPYASANVKLKWPNDIIIDDRKVGGILIETRWRDDTPEWVAIAIGLNVKASPADIERAASLAAHANRLDVLAAIIPAMRSAAAQRGKLSDGELAEWRARDWLIGKRVLSPLSGRVTGMLATGDLLIETRHGPESVRSGSVTLEEA